MSDNAAPLFPSVTVDFNTLHDELAAGTDPIIAGAKAIAAGGGAEIELPEPLPRKRDDLIKVAKKEEVEVANDATVAEITTAIESKRAAALKEDTGLAESTAAPEPSSDGAAK